MARKAAAEKGIKTTTAEKGSWSWELREGILLRGEVFARVERLLSDGVSVGRNIPFSAPSSLVNLQPMPQMATVDRLPFFIDDREIQEATLVSLVVNALQGVKSALDDIEKLSTVFCCNPAA
ncbi:hypothetical protein MRB53_018798 [Persea americana]|uniref:Uncharacterized protein n=1 Tax=Persea americana TaxID=3435 RepID=A0ACC2M9V4_PERAE|nr:hypothetical protein MRB53_018798 [Persea americana]